MEALSCGLAVLSTGGGGIPEILTDKRLGKISAREESIFAEKIEDVLKTKDNDRDYRRNYVKENWPWPKSADRLEKLLKETLKQT